MEKTRRFSSPAAAIEALRLQWEAFQSRGAILEGVRPEIAASWRRSAQLKLRCELPAVPLDEAALRGFDHAGQARHQFLGAGCKLADHLADELQDTNSAVIVCDDFGVLLYRIGSPDILRRSRSVNLVPGGVWGEKEAGTNGVGLALELGAPAHVYAAEHYMGAFHGFSCTGAPVHHPVTREVLGVLGLATDTSIAGSFAPALIARAARDVERLLEEQVFGRERELLEHYLRGRAGRQAPFLTVDRSGHTIIQNARMLQTATAEDVQLLLSIARHALHSETDAAEQLELSGGRSQAQVRLVHAGSELLGALVSVERAARPRPERACPAREDWAPLVGRSPAMERLFKEASKVAEQRMTVAVYGEPGTGKLTLAELLHRRKGDQEPLTVVHCSRRAWAEEWRDALRAGGTIVLNRVHALSAEAQLELADELDALATRSEPPWVISLVNSEAKPPGAELLFRLSRVSLTPAAARPGARPAALGRRLVRGARARRRKSSRRASGGPGGAGRSGLAGERPRVAQRPGRGSSARRVDHRRRVAPARHLRGRAGAVPGRQPARDRARRDQRCARPKRRQRDARGAGARDWSRDASPPAAGLPAAESECGPGGDRLQRH